MSRPGSNGPVPGPRPAPPPNPPGLVIPKCWEGTVRSPLEVAAILRAMSVNYPIGSAWDELDAKTCREAADALNIAFNQRDAYVVALEVEVHTLRQRAVRAHQICNLARVTYPEIGELADDGCLHEAIHDILRVDHAQRAAPGAHISQGVHDPSGVRNA